MDNSTGALRRFYEDFTSKNPTFKNKTSFSFLRVAVELTNTKADYDFNIKKDVGTALSTDQKLSNNNAFMACAWRIGLLKEDTTRPGSGVIQTYPNQQVFAPVATVIDPVDFECIYAGYLTIRQNNTDLIPSMKGDLFRFVGTSQQSTATNYSEKNALSGFFVSPHYLMLQGDQTYDIKHNVPTYSGKLLQYTTGTIRNYIVLDILGYEIIQGSNAGLSS